MRIRWWLPVTAVTALAAVAGALLALSVIRRVDGADGVRPGSAGTPAVVTRDDASGLDRSTSDAVGGPEGQENGPQTGQRGSGDRLGAQDGSENVAEPLPASDVWPLPESCREAEISVWAPSGTPRARSALSGEDLPGADQLADYQIEGDRLLAADTGRRTSREPTDCAERLWSAIRALYPPAGRRLLTHLVIYDGSRAQASEDRDVAAFVRPIDEELGEWLLAVDPAFGEPADLAETLVHELAHLLTLNGGQVDTRGPDRPTCPTEPTSQGCSLPGSIYDDYVHQAWDPAVLRRWWELYERTDGEPDQEELAAFHEEYREHFVSPYAASDPEEDLAETLAAWCTGRRVSGEPILAKVDFLARRAELAQLPQRCRVLH